MAKQNDQKDEKEHEDEAVPGSGAGPVAQSIPGPTYENPNEDQEYGSKKED